MQWRNEGTFHLMRRVMQAHNALWRRRLPDLTPVQYSVLLSLLHLPGLDQRTIGAASAVEPTTMANLIDRMETRGLLARMTDPSERRRQLLTLSAAGRAELRRASPIVKSVRDEFLSGLPVTDVEDLRSILLALAGQTQPGSTDEPAPIPAAAREKE